MSEERNIGPKSPEAIKHHPLVGREEEVKLVVETFHQRRSGHPNLWHFNYWAIPGMGLTSLGELVCRQCAYEGITVAKVNYDQEGQEACLEAVYGSEITILDNCPGNMSTNFLEQLAQANSLQNPKSIVFLSEIPCRLANVFPMRMRVTKAQELKGLTLEDVQTLIEAESLEAFTRASDIWECSGYGYPPAVMALSAPEMRTASRPELLSKAWETMTKKLKLFDQEIQEMVLGLSNVDLGSTGEIDYYLHYLFPERFPTTNRQSYWAEFAAINQRLGFNLLTDNGKLTSKEILAVASFYFREAAPEELKRKLLESVPLVPSLA
ncbi:MAG: hypothetical protein M1514_02150 [Patescibacteria group bacterium]|nr:hypothetical protein [Patescibacteria group bacterium]